MFHYCTKCCTLIRHKLEQNFILVNHLFAHCSQSDGCSFQPMKLQFFFISANQSESSQAEGTSNPTANEDPPTDERGFIVWPHQQQNGAAATADDGSRALNNRGHAPSDATGGADTVEAQRAVAALAADNGDVQVRVVRPQTQRAQSEEEDEESE